MTLQISLPKQLETLVHTKVSSGLYSTANQVVHEALMLLDDFDRVRLQRLKTLRSDLTAGVKSGKGKTSTAKDVIARAKQRRDRR